jgi:hypothetical protein
MKKDEIMKLKTRGLGLTLVLLILGGIYANERFRKIK